MRKMRIINKMSALFIVFLFILSFSIAGNSAAIPTTSDGDSSLLTLRPIDLSVTADEGTNVDWYTDTGSYNDTWSWQNNNWLFGPRAAYEIYYLNGSVIKRDEFIPLNEEISFVVKVPEDMLRGADLQSVDVNAYLTTSDMNFSSGFDFHYYNGTPESWYGDSHTYNSTSGVELPPYVDLNIPASSSYSVGTMHYIVFNITFYGNTPVGLYSIDVNVYDSDNNNYNLYSPWSNDYGFYEYALGVPRSQAFAKSYDGGYTIEKYDLNGDLLNSATRGKDFIYRFNITGNGDLAYAFYNLNSIDSFQLPVNASGTHTETVPKTGGWVFDPLLQIYYFNEFIEYETEEDVFGDYYNYDSNQIYDYIDYTYRVTYENPNTSLIEVLTLNGSQSLNLYYLYNFTSLTFEVIYGFYYHTYPSETYIEGLSSVVEWYVEPIENAPYLFYDLNTTRSRINSTDGTISLEFAGHFTDDAPKGTLFTITEFVYDKYGDQYGALAGDMGDSPMTTMELTQNRDVVVESPVTIANLKKIDDSPVFGYFFPAEQNEPFKVEASLQGGADIAEDIDGAVIRMNTYSSFWSEDESGYSNIFYEISIEKDGTTSYQAYNLTTKQNRTYGFYTVREEVQVTGNYSVWADVEVEGYYWEYFYYNQATGEWMTEEDWHTYNMYSYKSEATRVTYDFASISGLSHYTVDGDFFFEFLLNFTDAVPDSSFWWDFQFASQGWYDDESSMHGYYDVATWSNEWIYSFDYLGEEVYTDYSIEIGVSNSSITSDWLKVREDPYITINGEKYPIVTKQLIDSEDDIILFYDYQGYYYELLNSTKINVYSENAVWIYNVTVPGYGSFLSTQKEALHWYGPNYTIYGWWDINGNPHGSTDWMTWYENPTVELVHISDYVDSGHWIRVGNDTRLEVLDYPVNDPRTGAYYIVDLIGTRYDIREIDYYNYIFYEGKWQSVDYVEMSYEADYLGSPVFVPSWSQVQEQWFTVEGHHEMPYPGANADWTGVSYTTSNPFGGEVRTSKTVFINGEPYLLGGDPDIIGWDPLNPFNHTGFWVLYNSWNYTLDWTKMVYLNANGTEYWQPPNVAASFDYGHLDGRKVVSEGTLFVPSTYFVNPWFNGTHDVWTVTLENGTTFSCDRQYLQEVYLVDAEGELIYTRNGASPLMEMIDDFPVYYVEDLNGSNHYLSRWYSILPVIDALVAPAWEVFDGETWTYHYIVNETEYVTFEYPGFEVYRFTNGTFLTGKYFEPYASAPDSFGDQASWVFEFDYKGTPVNATAKLDYIFKVGLDYGLMKLFGLAPINSVTVSNFHEIIIGTPEYSMWGVRAWTISETGALDLDGDTKTIHDQYYVLQEYQSTNTYQSDWSRMWVDLLWDPNGTILGNEMHTHSWMGVETNGWSSQWQQTYYWYHAADMTPVSSAEMSAINATINNPDGSATPGYWDISHMAKNVTWEDILAEAIANGWDWISQDEQTWTWLSFGIGKDYGVESDSGYSSINLRYEYSGLMIWDDANNNSIMEAYLENTGYAGNEPVADEGPVGDNELTHYFIPDSVGSVSFVTPGEAYGVFDPSGTLLLGVEDEVSWGVTFLDVNGTTFPYNAYSFWDWCGGVVTGSDLRTFDERPTTVSIDEISFLVHFQGFINTTEDATSNYATIKVDNTVGQWDVDLIGGISNLEGKSLALNYLADVSTSQFKVEDMGLQDNEQTIVSDRFEIGDDSTRFAEMIIGGVTYEWAADPYSAYNVTSQTTPFSTFTSAYESEAGQSATSWSFTSTQYYVTIGFPHWDGYYVYQDPIFVAYISNTGDTGDSVQFSSMGINPEVPSSTDSVTISIGITTSVEIWNVDLYYSTDGFNFDSVTTMWSDSPDYWVGDIPPYPDDTQIWYKVVVITEAGVYESVVQSYIVGQGAVTTPPFPTTTTSGPTGPGGIPEISTEMLLMLGGLVLVVVVLGVMAKRRK